MFNLKFYFPIDPRNPATPASGVIEFVSTQTVDQDPRRPVESAFARLYDGGNDQLVYLTPGKWNIEISAPPAKLLLVCLFNIFLPYVL